MEIEFDGDALRRLASDPGFDAGFGRDVVKAFRKRIQLIRAVPDERDFYAMRSLKFEKLKGKRSDQHSMRLNDQWRLILKLVSRNGGNVVVVVEVADYH